MSPPTPTDEQALYAWDELRDWLSYDEEGKALLARFTADPEGEAGALRHWLRTRGNEAPPQVATYVHGGQVDRLVNIAQAGVVQYTTIHDSSGWWVFLQARGLARLLMVLGMVLALAGFASFGYPIIKAIANFNTGDAAQQECHERFDPGPELINCLAEASANNPGGEFEATPWIPLGAVLFLAGAVLMTAGTFMIRAPGGRPAPGSYTR
ncbi:MAG TPA: hypothetical protein VHK46_02190 [Gaiellaceae bacterium]|jgi:hypothetical protein|nr:hypothetical protein [Gaiellaceae bacterium]